MGAGGAGQDHIHYRARCGVTPLHLASVGPVPAPVPAEGQTRKESVKIN
jgi:hypothetical protein